MRPTKLVVDLSKPVGEQETVIELTDEEIAQQEELLAQAEAEEQAYLTQQVEKEKLIAKLSEAGFTDDEIAVITG